MHLHRFALVKRASSRKQGPVDDREKDGSVLCAPAPGSTAICGLVAGASAARIAGAALGQPPKLSRLNLRP